MDGEFILRLFVQLFCIVFWVYFYYSTLKPRWSKKITILGLFGVSVFITMPIIAILYDYYTLKMILAFIIDLIMLRVFFVDSLFRIIFIRLIFTILLTISELAAAIFSELILHLPLAESYSNLKFPILVGFAVYFPMIALSFLGGAKLINKLTYKVIPLGNLLRLGFFLIPQMFILAYLAFLIIFKTTSIFGPYLVAFVLCLVLSVIADILLYRTLKEVAQKAQLETENLYLNIQKDMQLQHYQAYIDQQNNIRKLRHDIMNHVQTIKLLIAGNETAAADEYADKLAERFEKITTIDYCDNKVIDAVLHNKVEYAAALGVKGYVKTSVPAQGKVDDLDLMVIFSNLLDNAIHAAAKADGEKYFSISSVIKAGIMTIKVENTGDGGEVVLEQTGKTSGEHGLGLGIVRDTAAKHNGSFELTQVDNCYLAVVTLDQN